MDRSQGDPADVGVAVVEGLRSASLFDPASDTFQPAAPMKYGRWYPHLVVGPDGNATAFGGVTRLLRSTQLGNVRRTETYHADTNTWEENYAGPASETELPLVPRMILAPNGQFFYPAVGQMWGPAGASVGRGHDGVLPVLRSQDQDVVAVGPRSARGAKRRLRGARSRWNPPSSA